MHTFATQSTPTRHAGQARSAILKQPRLDSSTELSAIRHLQQALGNQAMQRLLEGDVEHAEADTDASEHGAVQTKLTMSVPGDQYEREADRVADQVMGMATGAGAGAGAGHASCCAGAPPIRTETSRHSGASVMRQAAHAHAEEENDLGKQGAMVKLLCPECEDLVQRKETSSDGAKVSKDVESRIDSVKGEGAPLSAPLRAFFEPRLGHDFSKVKIHTGASAGETAQRMNALAYTTGPHIVFAPGQFAPDSHEGKKLLAHELTHVVQQSASTRLLDAAGPAPAHRKDGVPDHPLPLQALASPIDIHLKADPDHIFRHTSAYCDRVFEECNEGCRSLPNRTKAQKARRAACWSRCIAQYAACLASSDEALAGILTTAAIVAAIVLASADGPFPIGDAAAVALLGMVGINVF